MAFDLAGAFADSAVCVKERLSNEGTDGFSRPLRTCRWGKHDPCGIFDHTRKNPQARLSPCARYTHRLIADSLHQTVSGFIGRPAAQVRTLRAVLEE